MGRKSEIEGLDFLGIGVTFASFHVLGNTPSEIDCTKICVNGGARILDAALRRRGVRWSWPDALPTFNFFRRISVSSTESGMLKWLVSSFGRTNREADGFEKDEESTELIASGMSAGIKSLRRFPQLRLLFEEGRTAFQIPFGDFFSCCIHAFLALYISFFTFSFRWRYFGNCFCRYASKRQLIKSISI